MFQDVASKWWYPATIPSLCVQPRSYMITTSNGVTFRKMQAHLKPYQSSARKEKMNILIVITTSSLMILNVKTIKNSFIQDQGDTFILQLNLIYDVLNELCINKVDISCLKQIAHKWPPKRG